MSTAEEVSAVDKAIRNFGLSATSGTCVAWLLTSKFHFAEIDMDIRTALKADSEIVSKLLNQLGYQASPELIRDKLETLNSSSCDTVLLAQDGDNIVGVISLHVLELFHQPGRLGRITSLVIDDAFRGQGVGALLVCAADAFFKEQGCVRAEVTSGDHRVPAHTFYPQQGYEPDERRFVKRYDASGAA